MTAQERAELIKQVAGTKLARLIQEAASLGRAPAKTRPDKILDIADELSRTITPHTPCRNGCSHCCHMATALSGYEARTIGRYVGREPVKLGRENAPDVELREKLLERFTGVPCTFLSNGRCSIYPVRPAACRLHHSLNDTEDNCRIAPGREKVPVPQLNLTPVQMILAAIFFADDFGDIREFFPPE